MSFKENFLAKTREYWKKTKDYFRNHDQTLNPKQKNRYKWGLRIFWTLFITPFVLLTLLFTLIIFGAFGPLPSFEELENPTSNLASEVISSDGILLGKYYRENRTPVEFNAISPFLVDALVATEDERFYEHSGVDFWSLGRVLVRTIMLGQDAGGGSTVSQQLAKNLFRRQDLSTMSSFQKKMHIAVIKFKEWVIAVKLEKNYTKREIIQMYFNTVPFGYEAFGIKSAAATYFSSTPDALKVEEAAVLVGMLKAPTKFSPRLNPENSLKRRNVVMFQMYKNKILTRQQYDSLSKLDLVLKFQPQNHSEGLATYFREYLRTMMSAKRPTQNDYPSWQYQQYREDSIDWVNNPLFGWCNKNQKPNGEPYDLYKDGLKIYVTINSKMQKYAENAVNEHMGLYLQKTFHKDIKSLKRPPFSNQISEQQYNDIIQKTISRSERYRVLKEAGFSKEEIIKNFNTPVEMTIFKWRDLAAAKNKIEDLDSDTTVTMTPLDSILYYKKILRAGFMSMEPQTGHVKAYVAGINYKHFKYDHVKLAKRQVGSTFKPFIYTLAMSDRYFPCTKVLNVAYSFKALEKGEDVIYTPQYSSSDRDGENITLKYGLANSLNQISAWILRQYSPQDAINIARNMGVRSPIDAVPALCVGSAEVTLYEMVGAYSTFANMGFYVEPILVTRIQDKDGNEVGAPFKAKRREAISAQTAWLMIELMRGVVDYGTSARLRFKYKIKTDIAGKTGTTNNNSDGWFMGITSGLVSGAWVGGEERSIHFRSTDLGQGANMALPIWALYMKKCYEDSTLSISTKPFEKPANVNYESDCNSPDNQNNNQQWDPGFDDIN